MNRTDKPQTAGLEHEGHTCAPDDCCRDDALAELRPVVAAELRAQGQRNAELEREIERLRMLADQWQKSSEERQRQILDMAEAGGQLRAQLAAAEAKLRDARELLECASEQWHQVMSLTWMNKAKQWLAAQGESEEG